MPGAKCKKPLAGLQGERRVQDAWQAPAQPEHIETVDDWGALGGLGNVEMLGE